MILTLALQRMSQNVTPRQWSNFRMFLVYTCTFYIGIPSKPYAMNRVGDFVPLILPFSTQLDQRIWISIRVDIYVFLHQTHPISLSFNTYTTFLNI